jgi:hypothetical protein
MSRSEFEEKNRRLLMGHGFLPEIDVFAWERGRDWLAHRTAEHRPGMEKRRSPRLRLSLTAHIAGVGRAVTDDIGFGGMRLQLDKQAPLTEGSEASVRLDLAGRSIYVLGQVVWTDDSRVGMALRAAHPADERALQAAVCSGLLDRWDS